MANQVVENGVKLMGERFLPGTSLMMDGDIKGGLVHAALGLAARAAFGPVAWFAVAADSYSRSVTGKGLIEHLAASVSPAAASGPTTEPL
ncbi:MAG TPA: DUF6072 family protein [Thermoanaerobaculia bacterium]|jgi:hypothetical protein